MNKNDFHIPFIKSLVIVAIVTIFSMVSSHYVVNYYMTHSKFATKHSESSTQGSYTNQKH